MPMNVHKIDAEDFFLEIVSLVINLNLTLLEGFQHGKEHLTKDYKAATICVDHASHFISLSLGQSTGGDEL